MLLWFRVCVWCQVGSFNVAVIAKAMNKPVYVAVESFKFVRVYPLNQQGLPNKFKVILEYLTVIRLKKNKILYFTTV